MCTGMCTMFGGVVGMATISWFCAFVRVGAADSTAANKIDAIRGEIMPWSSLFSILDTRISVGAAGIVGDGADRPLPRPAVQSSPKSELLA
jgi:hypothetical protein